MICRRCGETIPQGRSACALCTQTWDCRELRFSPLPVEESAERLADWPASLSPPALLAIEADAGGLRVRLYSQPGADGGAASAWASATRQQSRWAESTPGFPGSGSVYALASPDLLPMFSPSTGDAFLSVGGALLTLARTEEKPVTLVMVIHGREDGLQARLRALFSYATGTEKGVEDDTPNPWHLRLQLWRSAMAAGAGTASVGAAAYGPGWVSQEAAALAVIGGGLLGLAGFLGTQRWMQWRSLPARMVEPRLEGALLRISTALFAENPHPLRLLAGEQRWIKLPGLWPDARRFAFPARSADLAALIAPPETGEGSGMFAPGTVQETPIPPPSAALRRAPVILGQSPADGEPIGIDAAGHTLVVGGSRSGKSSAVFNLLLEMLAEPAGGPGLFLVDPHGSLADAFLHSIDLLPANERTAAVDRLRIITPHPDTVIPLNPLVLPDFTWAGNALVQAGQRIWTDFWGPRMQAALLSLARLVHAWNLAHPEAGLGLMHTIAAAYRPEWRAVARALLPQDRQAGGEALEALLGQDKTSGRPNRQWVTEVVSPIVSKLMALELSPWLYAALHENGFVDLEGWIRDRCWIVLRLPTGEVGREGARLAAGMVYNIFEAAFRKAAATGPIPFNFVIDEVQEIGSAMALESLLSEGGKFGARIFVLAQSLSLLRLSEGFAQVVQALLANTSAQLAFSPDPDDAEIIRELFGLPARYGSTTADLPTLHAWLRARLDGRWQPPTIVSVRPLIGADPSRVQRIIEDVVRAHPDSYTRGAQPRHGIQTFMEDFETQKPGPSETQAPDDRRLGW